MKSSKIIFFGTEDFSAVSLQALLQAGFSVVAVITKPDAARGRSSKPVVPKVKTIAKQHNILVLQPTKLRDTIPQLAKLQPTHGVLVSYGKIVPQAVIDIFPGGIVNVHPSLLPAYRGPTPMETAILQGDKQTGVTLMQLSAAMDAGPIYTQQIVPLQGDETKPQLYDKLATIGAQLLVDSLPLIINNKLTPTPQDTAKATYTHLLSKDDAPINWQWPAMQIQRKIRAHLGFPKSKATIFGQNVVVTAARVATSQHDGALVLPCQNAKSWLEITQLIAPSGRSISGADFLRGYQK